MKFFISGDTHADFSRFIYFPFDKEEKKDIGVIILGDACLNYYGATHLDNPKDKRDEYNKQWTNSLGLTFYCVRGNHEFRPELLDDMILEYDENVEGMVYYQENFPNIKYFKNWGIYTINGLETLVIGGAYSVDKNYRISCGRMWYPNEQLSEIEKFDCYEAIRDKSFDLVLTHTCPYDWRPTDLFLPSIDQEQVDTSTEEFLQMIADRVPWGTWCWGHYHDDREYPPLEGKPGRKRYMFYESVQLLEEIVN